MRTIGTKNINYVKRMTRQAYEKDTNVYIEEIRDSLPGALWDSWEGADSEISRIIYDELSRLQNCEP